MFTTIDAVVDQGVKSAKSVTGLIQDKNIREGVETLVKAQADFAKSVYKTSAELNAVVVESAKQYDFFKLFSQAK